MLKKTNAFKPKARPRPNGGNTQSSAKPSVERQTQTPAPLSQPTAVPADATESNADHTSQEAVGGGNLPAPEVSITQQPETTTAGERQSTLQKTTAKNPYLRDDDGFQSVATLDESLPKPQRQRNPFLRDDDGFQPIAQAAASRPRPRTSQEKDSVPEVTPQTRTHLPQSTSHGSVISNTIEITTTAASEPPTTDETRSAPQAHPPTSLPNAANAPPSHRHPTAPASSGLTNAASPAPLTTHEPTASASQTTATPSLLDAGSTGHSGNGAVEANETSPRVSAVSSRVGNRPARRAAPGEETAQGESRPAKRRKVTGNSREDVRPSIEDETSQPESSAPKRQRRRKPKDPNAPKRKRKKSATPEDAEEQVVDKATTMMSDLTKDLGIGRNFSMRETILQRELERKEKARIAREKELLEDTDVSDDEGGSGPNGENPENAESAQNTENGTPTVPEAATNNDERPSIPVAARQGPSLRVVNGQIVLDETSLQVDRHALAAEGAEEMAIVEQDDFTRIVTAGTNAKREKNIRWGYFETEKFYEGLQMFGTDFESIAKTFGKKRSRRHIKLKFNKEEVDNPDRIKKCLTGSKQAMDLSKLKGGSKLEDTDVIMAEIAALEKSYEDEENREKEALAEADRRKKDTIRAGARGVGDGGGGGGGTESSKENETNTSGNARAAPKKKAPAKKKTKRAMQQHMGGEDFEVIGTI